MIRVSSMLFFFNMAVGLIAGTDNQGKAIDTQCSSLTIHVGKAGIFSAVAHEHWVNAPIASGTVNDNSAAPAVRFAIDARKLSVIAEKGLSDKDQAEVQSNMHSKVLESSAYPEILFRSNHVVQTNDRAWRVTGELTLHGATRPVIVEVTRDGKAYVGTVRIKQTDFGIQPIKIGGGIVRVKDELEINFNVYTTSC